MGVVIRQSLKGTFVNYVGVILGIFVTFYFQTKWLDPEIIGLQKVLYEVAFLLSTLSLLGSGSGGMRFFPFFRDKQSGNHGFLFYYLLFPVVGTVLFTLVYLVCQGPILAYFGKNSPLFNQFYYYVLPLMLVLAFWVWFENYANIHMRIAVPKAIREIGMRVLMMGIYFAYGMHYIGVEGLILCFIVAYFCCMLATGIYSMHIGETTLKHDWRYITPDLRGKVLRYSGFLMLATISSNIMSQLDIFMLSGVKGLYSAGVYTIVVYMAEVVNMPSRNITPISTPQAATAMKEGDIEQAQSLYRQVSIHQMLASSVLLLIVWINLDSIFAILPNGDKYAEGRWAVLFLGLSKVIYGTLNFGNTLISFSRYYYWTLFVTFLLTFITIGTNLYFIPLWGLSGAALATLLTCILSYSYQQYLVQVKLKANPFTWAHLRMALILVVLFGVNQLIPSMHNVLSGLWGLWLDVVVRTLLICGVCVVAIYMLHISPQIDWFIRKCLRINR